MDGSDSFNAQSAYTNAAAISQQYAVTLTDQQLSPLDAHIQILYNPDLEDLWFIVPGFGAFLLYGIALKLTAFAIVREREAGTIEALLVTPIRPIELMLGKMIPNLCVAVLNLVLTFSVGMLIFGVPFRGSLLLFSALASLFAIGSLGSGFGNLFRFSESGAGESIGILDEYCRYVRKRFYVSCVQPAADTPRVWLHHAHDFFPADCEWHYHKRSRIE